MRCSDVTLIFVELDEDVLPVVLAAPPVWLAALPVVLVLLPLAPPDALPEVVLRAPSEVFPEEALSVALPEGALVLQEAALAGVPSVLLDEVLYERGVLARQAVLATAETFADGIISLLRDPASARALGARARENAERHTPEAFASAVLDIYRTATGHPAPVRERIRDEAVASPLRR